MDALDTRNEPRLEFCLEFRSQAVRPFIAPCRLKAELRTVRVSTYAPD